MTWPFEWDAELEAFVAEVANGGLVGVGASATNAAEVWRGDRTGKAAQWMYPPLSDSDEIALIAKLADWVTDGAEGDAPDGWVRSNWSTDGRVFWRRRTGGDPAREEVRA